MSGETPCDGCIAGCCRETWLLPTGHDVFRIATTLRLPLADFLTLRPRDRAEGDFRIILPSIPGAFHRLEVRKIEEPSAGFARRCVFLLTVGERGRCGIYQVRPAQCSRYPLTFDQPSNEPFNEGRAKLIKRLPYCPPDSWSLAMLDVEGERLRHRGHERNVLVHDRVIERWNERIATTNPGAGEQDFLDYLLASYERLSASGTALFAAMPGAELVNDRASIFARVDEILG